jgi:hypothetical protein
MRSYYHGDPYWLTAKYPGTCAGCGKPFVKGERVFRFKNGKLYAERCGCGTHESASFQAAAADEYTYNQGGY